ncbi:hypothetical protein [Sphingomonas sp. ACRSK]|uniref:hypothetical protein n=1 Tax=Sphingomonas sp. ACRSK TaxID=2918213 RepID=UPI001EF5D82F|nr:hypothetical protein [Sphingomonas sp. ACRSK]MCG7348845.1 hypothetical protein [Sphingomonas sp. ACRSK]
MWAIYCEADLDLAWSNEHGWVDTPTFDLFTADEKGRMSLPMGGIWRKVAP